MGGGDARGGAYDPAMAAASMAAHQAAYGAVPQAPAQAKKPVIRVGAGETWLDPTLSEWPDSKYSVCLQVRKWVHDSVCNSERAADELVLFFEYRR